MTHPALTQGRAAVVTGAARGIGLAAVTRFAALGMAVCIADADAAALQQAAHGLASNGADVLAVPTDVSDRAAVEALHEACMSRWGGVAVLMNNAGRQGGGGLTAPVQRWHTILDTNFGGVLNGVQVFSPGMISVGKPAAIINTGSKQGITTPPGDTAYNVSKAAIKVLTEALAHDLIGTPVTAHLLIPGFTDTKLTRREPDTAQPLAWTADQVADFMLGGLAAGDFYILCPDNQTTRETDERRMRWAADDIILNRPALSRWHPDFAQAFADYMKR